MYRHSRDQANRSVPASKYYCETSAAATVCRGRRDVIGKSDVHSSLLVVSTVETIPISILRTTADICFSAKSQRRETLIAVTDSILLQHSMRSKFRVYDATSEVNTGRWRIYKNEYLNKQIESLVLLCKDRFTQPT